MAAGSMEIHVDRKPEDVFAYVSDLENAPQWVPDLVSVTKKTDGEIGVGTRYDEVVRMGKNEGEAQLEVTEYDPPRSFAHRGQGGPSRFTARFTFTPDGDGTRLKHDYTVQLSGFAKLMTPMITGWVRKNADAGMQKLKEALEQPR